MRRLCLHKAIQLTATLVGVAMSAPEGEHNPGRVPTVGKMQVFHVEDDSRVEGRCGKSKHSSPRSDYNWLRQGCVAREDKESATLRGIRSKTYDLVCSGA